MGNQLGWTCKYCYHVNSSLDSDSCANCRQKTKSPTSTQPKLKSIEVNKSLELHLKLIEKASQQNRSRIDGSQTVESSGQHSFIDVEFPPNKCSVYQKKKHFALSLPSFIQKSPKVKKPKYWLRPTEIANFGNKNDSIGNESYYSPIIRLYSSSTMPKDVFQGGVGSCWLIAALCVLADRPELLAKTLITKQYNPNGLHQISFCRRGEWLCVNIDDYLPCNRDGKIIFSHSKSNDLWVSFVEKALAKMYGSYDAIASGSCVEGLQTLTGEPCEILYLEKLRGICKTQYFSALSHENPFFMWKRLLAAKRCGHLMTTLCYNRAIKFVDLQRTGLLRRHIYSILDVKELRLSGEETVNLVKLRNPWGKKVWRGAWSDEWTRWPTHLRAELLSDSQRSAEHGCFWIAFDDLIKYFYDVTICKIRPHWFESRHFSQCFYDYSSGAQVYLLSVQEPGEFEFEIELFATGRRMKLFDRNADPAIDLCLIICKFNSIQNSLECIGFVHDIEYFVSISRKLHTGNYVLFATSFRAIHNTINESENNGDNHVPNFYTYNLIMHGECNFRLSQTVLASNKVAELFYSVALKENNVKYELDRSVRTLSITTNSTHAILVENLSRSSFLRLNVDLSQSKNLQSTRDEGESSFSSLIEDYLGPLSKQLVVYLTPNNYRKAFSIGYKLEFELVEENATINKFQNPSIRTSYAGLHCSRRLAI